MAQTLTQMQRDIEWQLDWSLSRWGRLPDVEAEIVGWDLIDQIDFVEDRSLEEERLRQLERHAAEGVMTPEQAARFEELQGLVAKHRLIVRRLRES